MGSEEQNRFLQHQQPPPPRRKRWGGCLGGLSCFGAQKGGKRVVPASRISEAHNVNQPNGPQAVGLANQNTTIAPSLLAPPSSPASFSNSALPSTVQSPNCCLSLSANSPGGPSSSMYATGPYAHETQLVSPPVFSTFTTEPSTAPLTPPPELAHLTTPSSPDVPFAQFLSSSLKLKSGNKGNYIAVNDLQATYSLYPGSPASCLRSPISRTSGECSSSFPDREFPPQWDPSIPSQESEHSRSESGRLVGLDSGGASKLNQDSNFFCPATFAQFYLDQSSFPHSGGRLSVSKESDVYPSSGNTLQSRQTKTSKQDVEEIEAYRASFGFSADEIITTAHYVEISDVMEDSFSMMPFSSNKRDVEEIVPSASTDGRTREGENMHMNLLGPKSLKSEAGHLSEGARHEGPDPCNDFEDSDKIPLRQHADGCGCGKPIEHDSTDDEDIFSKMGASRISRNYQMGLSSSDAEIDYRRGRSLREGRRLRMA